MGRTYHKLSVGRESFEIDTRSVLLSQVVAQVVFVSTMYDIMHVSSSVVYPLLYVIARLMSELCTTDSSAQLLTSALSACWLLLFTPD